MRNVSLLLKLSSGVAAVLLVAGCAMDPPGPSPIYSRLPSTSAPVQQALTPEQQMERYNAIDKQALAESQQSATAGNNAKMMSGYTATPISVYGGYSSGGWGGPYWGTGVGFGTWW